MPVIGFVVFWIAVIVAAHREPWWLPVAVGAGAAPILGTITAASQSIPVTGTGFLMSAIGGAFSGLIVIGVRALLRRYRKDPLE